MVKGKDAKSKKKVVDAEYKGGKTFSTQLLEKKKSTDGPKKPMSSFFCYQMQRREELKKANSSLDHKEIVSV